MIDITLNGEAKQLAGELSIAALIAELGQRPELIVAELNEHIYKRNQYSSVVIKAGDTVELLRFVGGG